MDNLVLPMQSRFNRDLSQHLRWLNESGESVPAFGVVRLTDYDTTNREHKVSKPNGDEGLYYVNGPVAVASGDRGGSSTWDTPRLVLTDSGETLAVGDLVGPVDGQWYMSSAGTGFRVFAAPNANHIAAVERIGGGSSAQLVHGIVVRKCSPDCNSYFVRIVRRTIDEVCTGTGT